jgi:hypothetical protein
LRGRAGAGARAGSGGASTRDGGGAVTVLTVAS